MGPQLVVGEMNLTLMAREGADSSPSMRYKKSRQQYRRSKPRGGMIVGGKHE